MRSETDRRCTGFHPGLTYGSFLVDGFDDEFLVVEGDISDLTPGEADLWSHPGGRKALLFILPLLTAPAAVTETPTYRSARKCWVPRRPLPATAPFLSYSWCWNSWPHTSPGLGQSSDTPSWIPLCGPMRWTEVSWNSRRSGMFKHREVFSLISEHSFLDNQETTGMHSTVKHRWQARPSWTRWTR